MRYSYNFTIKTFCL